MRMFSVMGEGKSRKPISPAGGRRDRGEEGEGEEEEEREIREGEKKGREEEKGNKERVVRRTNGIRIDRKERGRRESDKGVEEEKGK